MARLYGRSRDIAPRNNYHWDAHIALMSQHSMLIDFHRLCNELSKLCKQNHGKFAHENAAKKEKQNSSFVIKKVLNDKNDKKAVIKADQQKLQLTQPQQKKSFQDKSVKIAANQTTQQLKFFTVKNTEKNNYSHSHSPAKEKYLNRKPNLCTTKEIKQPVRRR